MIKPSVTVKSLATSVISCAQLLTVSAERATEMIDNIGSAGVHATAMLDDLAADGHNATSMSGAFNRLERQANFAKKYKDASFELPPGLAASI